METRRDRRPSWRVLENAHASTLAQQKRMKPFAGTEFAAIASHAAPLLPKPKPAKRNLEMEALTLEIAALQAEKTNLEAKMKLMEADRVVEGFEKQTLKEKVDEMEDEARVLVGKLKLVNANNKILEKDLDAERARTKELEDKERSVLALHARAKEAERRSVELAARAHVQARSALTKGRGREISLGDVPMAEAMLALLERVILIKPFVIEADGNSIPGLARFIDNKPETFLIDAQYALGCSLGAIPAVLNRLYSQWAPQCVGQLPKYRDDLQKTMAQCDAEWVRIDTELARCTIAYIHTLQCAGTEPPREVLEATTSLGQIHSQYHVHRWESVAFGDAFLASVRTLSARVAGHKERTLESFEAGRPPTVVEPGSVLDCVARIALVLEEQRGTHAIVPKLLAESLVDAFSSAFSLEKARAEYGPLTDWSATLVRRGLEKRREVMDAETAVVERIRARVLLGAIRAEAERILVGCAPLFH